MPSTPARHPRTGPGAQAYGRIGSMEVGGTEIIGYETASGTYRTWFYDSFGDVSSHHLTFNNGTWTWQGETTRATATFSDDGKVQTAKHERTDDRATWVASMQVTLSKVGP